MRKTGFLIFALLSLIVHVTTAAVLMPDSQAVQQERGAGAAALEIGSAFDSAASAEAEPEEIKQVLPDVKEVSPTRIRQAIAVKEFVAQPVQHKLVTAATPVLAAKPLLKQLEASEKLTKPDILKPREVKPVKAKERKAVEKKKPAKKQKAEKKTKRNAKQKHKATRASRRGGAKTSKNGVKGGRGGAGGKKSRAQGRALVSNYKGKVMTKVTSRAYYPSSLRGSGTRGRVTVSFRVSSSGRATNIRISRSSGNAKLDQAAKRAVGRASPFGRFPQGMSKSPLILSVTMNMHQ